jgi:type I restriction enzyme S subunit
MGGWDSASIGEVCDVVNGGTPKTDVPEYWGGPHRWITPAEMGKRATPYIEQTNRTITDQGLQNSSARPLPKNSVILSSRAPIGHLVINTVPMATNQGCKGLVPGSRLDHKYLYYYLANIVDLLNELGTGTTFKELSGSKLKEVRVPLPPVAEQRRIVAILDEAFEGIATAKANAEKNLQNARELFDDYLREVFTSRGEGWVERTLDQVCKVERGSSPRPIKNFFTTSPDGVNWIKIGDTEQGGKYVYSTAQKITPDGAKQSRYVKEGDFILTNSMSFGRPYIMKIDGYIHDGWFALRLREELDTDYFYYLLSSQFVQAQFASLAAGAVVKNISGDLVKKAVLTIPPLVEQRAIVERFAVLGEETDLLAGLYRRKLSALDELKQSLLHQAFSGALSGRATTKQVAEVA